MYTCNILQEKHTMTTKPDHYFNDILLTVEKDPVTEKKNKVKKPKMYKVIYLNDDYTTVNFVVDTLVRFFNKSMDEAVSLAMHIHNKGTGVAGIYTLDLAETKANMTMDLARKNGFPLLLVLEPEDGNGGDDEEN